MRLTSEVILASENYLNAYNDREINFRGRKIPAIENLAILQDGYDIIDFSDNDIKKIDNFPPMNRLTTLLFHNNSISRIHPQIGKYLPNLTTIILNNNKIHHYYEIEHLASFPKLTLVSLLENPITLKPYYREFLIYKLPHLMSLDFMKITKQEKEKIRHYFETNITGKQFLIQIENEKQIYYQQLQIKSQQIASSLSSAAATTATAPSTSSAPLSSTTASSSTKPAAPPVVLTEEQKMQVKEAIERAKTKEEIDLIEHQLKTGTFVFTSKSHNNGSHGDHNNSSSSNGSLNDSSSGTKAGSKTVKSEDYAEMDVID